MGEYENCKKDRSQYGAYLRKIGKSMKIIIGIYNVLYNVTYWWDPESRDQY